MSEFKSGALTDTRPDSEKQKDHRFEELVASAAPVVWKEKDPSQWRRFPTFEQDGSGSCVAQTARKLMGIIYSLLTGGRFLDVSATHIYQRRINKPAAGMGGVDVFKIMQEGVTLDVFAPSDHLSDASMDGFTVPEYAKEVGKALKIGNYVMLPIGNFETIASVMQETGKGVMVWFFFTSEEWAQLTPEIKDPSLVKENALRHSVAAVDFFMYRGKKWLRVEDSAHFGGYTEHLISEEFFKARNYFAAYPMNFKFQEGSVTPTVPHHTFTKPLEFSAEYKTDPDVAALQDILKYEGLFPINVDSTGYYGAVTAKGVLAWQKKHAVAPVAELDALQGRRVGSKTIAVLNMLYSQ